MKILLVDSGLPFELNSLDFVPLGGSESSLLLLSKGLAELKNQVVILSTSTIRGLQDYYRIQDNTNYVVPYIEQSEVVIFNRVVPKNVTIDMLRNKLVYYYAHDAYDQPHVQWMTSRDHVNMFTKILCVSKWQADTFIKYFGVDENKLFVLGNSSYDPSHNVGYTERRLNKLVFASIPYKGLDKLSDIFNDVCIRTKRDDLELHIYSSMRLYNQEDTQYEKVFSELKNTKGVYLHNPISMKDLIYELKTSSIYIHPSTYHETFSMLLVQSLLAGCIPVCVNNGAISELIEDNINGFLTKGKNINNIECYNEFLDNIVYVLDNDLYKMRLDCKNSAKNYDYIKIADKLLKEINNGN